METWILVLPSILSKSLIHRIRFILNLFLLAVMTLLILISSFKDGGPLSHCILLVDALIYQIMRGFLLRTLIKKLQTRPASSIKICRGTKERESSSPLDCSKYFPMVISWSSAGPLFSSNSWMLTILGINQIPII